VREQASRRTTLCILSREKKTHEVLIVIVTGRGEPEFREKLHQLLILALTCMERTHHTCSLN
jgi:hypothetical protein